MRMRILSLGDELWKENINGGYATIFTLLFILLFQFARSVYFFFRRLSSSTTTTTLPHSSTPKLRTEDIITDDDLKSLIEHLHGMVGEDGTWGDVIEKRNNFLYYRTRCCKTKNCSIEVLRDFYMDNDYRMKWDKTIGECQQLQVDQNNGLEVGCTIKKFPFLTPREYVLAWRLWEGNGKSFYCFTKDCEHPWHQNERSMCMSASSDLVGKSEQVPSSLEATDSHTTSMAHCTSLPSACTRSITADNDTDGSKLLRKPSKKWMAKSLFLLGGIVCFSRGQLNLGAKIAMALMLTKAVRATCIKWQSKSKYFTQQ